jgi:hypothetical protein
MTRKPLPVWYRFGSKNTEILCDCMRLHKTVGDYLRKGIESCKMMAKTGFSDLQWLVPPSLRVREVGGSNPLAPINFS